MTFGTVGGALAQASEEANCVGEIFSTGATTLPPATVGQAFSEAAQTASGVVGTIIGMGARTDCAEVEEAN